MKYIRASNCGPEQHKDTAVLISTGQGANLEHPTHDEIRDGCDTRLNVCQDYHTGPRPPICARRKAG